MIITEKIMIIQKDLYKVLLKWLDTMKFEFFK